MSATAQKRRADKKQRRDRRQAARDQASQRRQQQAEGFANDAARDAQLEAALEQVAAALARRVPEAAALLARLAQVPDAEAPLRRLLTRHRVRLAANGWSAECLTHVVRRLGTRHARCLQEDEHPDVVTGVEVLACLLVLPSLPDRVDAALDPEDARMLTRVRALLAKAESSEFPDEAEALTRKAQELVSRYSLDRALADGAGMHRPTVRHVLLDDPYADAKSLLLAVVADANRCRSVFLTRLGLATVFGFDTDLRAGEMLFTSLLVQATRAMTVSGRAGASARQPSFRRSFLVSYATRIGQRLDEAAAQAVDAAADDRLLPVLAVRRDAVEAAVDDAFPDTVSKAYTPTSRQGWAAGRSAAELADLAAFEQVRAS